MKEKKEMPKSIPKYSSKIGRPLLLGEIDEMVQAYSRALSSRGGLINTAKALLERYPQRSRATGFSFGQLLKQKYDVT